MNLSSKGLIRKLLSLLLAAGSLLLLSASMPDDRSVQIIAHRGASGYAPENTIAAFDLALQQGADWLELDIRQSRDGEIVVMHDEQLSRVTGAPGAVQDYTLAELKEMDAGRRYSEEFLGERIPTLQEVLNRFEGRIGILIEIKDPELYPGMEDRLAVLVERFSGSGDIMLQSFHHETIRRLHARLPGIAVAALVREEEQPHRDEYWDELLQFCDYINIQQSLVNEQLIKRIHVRGRGVMAWTILNKKDMLRLKRIGVDGIITNYPAWK